MAKKTRKQDSLDPIRAIWQKVSDDFAQRTDGVPQAEVLPRYRECAMESLSLLRQPMDLSDRPKFAKHLSNLRLQLQRLIVSIDAALFVLTSEKPRDAVLAHGVEVGLAVANAKALIRFGPNAERHARHSHRAPSALKWTPKVAGLAEPMLKELTRGQRLADVKVEPLAKKVMARLAKEHNIDIKIGAVRRGVNAFLERHV